MKKFIMIIMMMLFGACASVPEVPEKPKALV